MNDKLMELQKQMYDIADKSSCYAKSIQIEAAIAVALLEIAIIENNKDS